MNESLPLLVKDENGVRHLILNRPTKLNAIDYAQHLRLFSEFKSAATDDSVRVVALSGMGRGFSAGDDLSAEPFQGDDPFSDRKVNLEIGSGPAILLESCKCLRNLPKPTVALMHGVALGSGYDYSLSCDFRLATKDIRYGDPRIDRALWAAEGWSFKLPRLANLSLVSRIAYLGEEMDGDKALQFGLVSEILSGDPDIRTSAQGFLNRLVSVAGDVYARNKEALLNSLDMNYEHAIKQQI
ncbi:MAG: enoyl-CoA hydratase/isomerase family protein [Gammaproteobacteria bacterium]|nr:enoyl-CoA hydratase/isomerase family protein [Gammaproteobacteria bacterium]